MTRWRDLLRASRGNGDISAPRGADGGIDQPPPAPPCPPGFTVGPPDFVGVGVQRCGTTRWCRLILAHPEVARPHAKKELHFFDRFHAGGFSEADVAAYHAYFPSDGQKTGEWTPLYASAPWIPPLLAAAAPSTRLLVLLRDPVERYLSGLELDIQVAATRGAPLSRYAPLEAFSRGFYHAALRRLLAHFDRSQLLVLQYERCTLEPAAQLRRTYSFLGLNDLDFTPDLDDHPRHQPEKPSLDAGTRAALVDAYRDDVTALATAFGEVDLALWPNFAHLAGDVSAR
jgi:Sulfotransferase family